VAVAVAVAVAAEVGDPASRHNIGPAADIVAAAVAAVVAAVAGECTVEGFVEGSVEEGVVGAAAEKGKTVAAGLAGVGQIG